MIYTHLTAGVFSSIFLIGGCSNTTPAQVVAINKAIVDSSLCTVAVLPAASTVGKVPGGAVVQAANNVATVIINANANPNCAQIANDIANAMAAGSVVAPTPSSTPSTSSTSSSTIGPAPNVTVPAAK